MQYIIVKDTCSTLVIYIVSNKTMRYRSYLHTGVFAVLCSSSITFTGSTGFPSDNSKWHCEIYPSVSTTLTVVEGVQQSPLSQNTMYITI
jgi:hypothetical protein